MEKIDHQPVLHVPLAVVRRAEAFATVFDVRQAKYGIAAREYDLVRMAHQHGTAVGEADPNGLKRSLAKNLLKLGPIHLPNSKTFLGGQQYAYT